MPLPPDHPFDPLTPPAGAPVTPARHAAGPAMPPLGRYYLAHLLSAVFPLSAGLVLYGWRGPMTVLVVILSTLVAILFWRRIGRRGATLSLRHGAWMAMLLGLMMPATLLTATPPGALSPAWDAWAILVSAGIALAIVLWLLGGAGHRWIHPAIAVFLPLAMLYGDAMTGRAVLHRQRIITGDLLPASPLQERDDAWISWSDKPAADAVRVEHPAAEELSRYTRGQRRPQQTWLTLDGLIRDAMPPLEDLVIGGHPGPVGSSSAVAVLIGGLFLLYRGLIDYRVPLLAVLAAYLALLLLPVPVAIAETGVQWRPAFLPRARLDWAVMLTFANYQAMASPLLFALFFLAPCPAIAPMHPRARAIYGIFIGIAAAACQLYLSCAIGPYLALAAGGLIAPALDRWARYG